MAFIDIFASSDVRRQAQEEARFALRTRGSGAENYLREGLRRADRRRRRQVFRLAIAALDDLTSR